MEHFEMVEKLRQKADITYEEARDALEATDWDILDALVLLEGQGKVRPAEKSEYSTQPEPEPEPQAKGGVDTTAFRKFFAFLRSLFQKGNANFFTITRKQEEVVSMPLTVLVLLLIIFWPFSFVVLGVGMFVGFRYSFHGPDMGAGVNNAMARAADAIQDKENRVE